MTNVVRYAWEPHRGGNWAALVAAGIPFGLGAFTLFLSTITYLVDMYQSGAAASGKTSCIFEAQRVPQLIWYQLWQRTAC